MSRSFASILKRLQASGSLLSPDSILADGSLLDKVGGTEVITYNPADASFITGTEFNAGVLKYQDDGTKISSSLYIPASFTPAGRNNTLTLNNDSKTCLEIFTHNGSSPLGSVLLQPKEVATILLNGFVIRKAESYIQDNTMFFAPSLISVGGVNPLATTYNERLGWYSSVAGGTLKGGFRIRLQPSQFSTATQRVAITLPGLRNCQSQFNGTVSLTEVIGVAALNAPYVFARVDKSTNWIRIMKPGSSLGLDYSDMAGSELTLEGTFDYKMVGF
jgi:hypothetical protein